MDLRNPALSLRPNGLTHEAGGPSEDDVFDCRDLCNHSLVDPPRALILNDMSASFSWAPYAFEKLLIDYC